MPAADYSDCAEYAARFARFALPNGRLPAGGGADWAKQRNLAESVLFFLRCDSALFIINF
jgi:hypothetical protein